MRQAEKLSSGIHIPSIKIDDYRGIKDLEIPRLGQVNLFAGESSRFRSDFLTYLLDGRNGATDAEMHPLAWKTVRYVADDDSFYRTNPDMMALMVRKQSANGVPRPILIQRLSEEIVFFEIKNGTVGERFIEIANAERVFQAGALFASEIGAEYGQPMKMPEEYGHRPLRSTMTPVVREYRGEYEFGYHYAEAGTSSEARFRSVIAIGADAVRLMMIASAIVVFSLRAENEGRSPVLLIDGFEVPGGRQVQARFWELILGEVKSRHIQLLATTNSWDCIAGFADAATAIDDLESTYFRLEQGVDRTHYVNYDPYTLQVSFEFNIDPR
ncbi:MAG: hypothetical protein OXC83_04560 [Chloroflexi bacterium]|nr:hypothetical protein [Chloroflexota bacterium]